MKPILQKIRPFLFPRRGKFTRYLLRWIKIFWIGASGGYKTWIRLNEPAQNQLNRQLIESKNLITPRDFV